MGLNIVGRRGLGRVHCGVMAHTQKEIYNIGLERIMYYLNRFLVMWAHVVVRTNITSTAIAKLVNLM